MNKYKLIISYDGTSYCGWQVQPNHTSIQELIEKALFIALKEKIKLHGSGRTDAGVHAKAQVAHFSTNQSFALKKLQYSLNGILDPEIRILRIESVDTDFHARFSATQKIYHYQIDTGSYQDPFQRRYSLHLRRKINLDLLKEACKEFIGTHDFTSFANESHLGSCKHNPVRTIYALNVIENGSHLILEFIGNGFLYKMVRNIVGCLIDVASQKLYVEDISKILKKKNRSASSAAVPAKGLFLVRVVYENSTKTLCSKP